MTFTYLPHNYGKGEGGCITCPAMGREGVDFDEIFGKCDL